MTLNQLRYFMEIAGCLNYSKASANLFISQPALSRSLSSLEEEMGVSLLERDSHHVSLTPAGEEFYTALKQMSAQFDSLLNSVKNISRGYEGTITIGLGLGYYFPLEMERIIDSIITKNQKIIIEPIIKSQNELVSMLDQNKLDFIFASDFGFIKYINVVTCIVGSAKTGVMVKASHPLAENEELSLNDLQDEAFLFIGNESSLLPISWQDLCIRHGFAPKMKYYSDGSSQLYAFENNIGVFLVNENFHPLKSYNNVFIPIIELSNSMHLLLYHPDSLSPCAKLLLNELNAKS